MDSEVVLSATNILDLKMGKTTRVTVDPEDFGVKEVLVIGIRLGEADVIQKIIDEVEIKAAPKVGLDYIKMMNQKDKARAVSKDEGAADDSTSTKTASIPNVDRADKGMEEYLRQQQKNKDTKGENFDIRT